MKWQFLQHAISLVKLCFLATQKTRSLHKKFIFFLRPISWIKLEYFRVDVLLCFWFIFELAFLKICKTGKKNTCVGTSFLIEVATLLKKRPRHRYVPVIFTKLLRTPFFIEHFRLTVLSLLLETLFFLVFLSF